MTQPDPRQQLRDLIAIRLHAAECGCATYRRDDSDDDDPLYTHMADAVMELFPDAELVREHHGPGLVVPVGRGEGVPADGTTHTRYELRTAPEPIEVAGRG